MNSTPLSNRFYIGIFGKCNSGKSSLINAITNQQIATISNKKGTTTDPVFKAMEIPKIGPCVFVDTPGFDDTEENLGEKRTRKSHEILEYVNAAIFVLEKPDVIDKKEKEFLEKIKQKEIPLILVINKKDIDSDKKLNFKFLENYIFVEVSAKTKENINSLIDLISKNFNEEETNKNMISDLINPLDVVVLVIVIDESSPKDRLILPQQQLIYEILKKGGICYVVKNTEYEEFLKNLNIKPKLIVIDSQIFSKIFKTIDDDIPITSFSILLARKKGILDYAIKGVKMLEKLKNKDKILIVESCTHKKKSCDITCVKIPRWILEYTKKEIEFEFKTGDDFPSENELKKYRLVIHCGGCMTTAKKIQNKFKICLKQNVAATNHGILIAYLNGVLEKSISFFK